MSTQFRDLPKKEQDKQVAKEMAFLGAGAGCAIIAVSLFFSLLTLALALFLLFI